MRKRSFCTGLLALLLTTASTPVAAATPEVELVGQTALPHGMPFEGTTVGGLSGIDFDPRTGQWVLISDDRSELQPARFYTARLELGREVEVELTGTAPLRRPDGSTYPARSLDPEDIRWDPKTGALWWTSEGDREGQLIDPSVRIAAPDGGHVGELPLPPNLHVTPSTGPKANEALEALTFTAGGALVVTAMEGPLLEDGESPTTEHGALTRITVQDRAGEVRAQYAYPLDPVFATSPTGGFSNNGISAILASGQDPFRYLVVERSFVTGVGNSIRIYEADVRGATDVRDVSGLHQAPVQPVRKRLLADLGELGLDTVDNIEGITWGPRLPDGRRSLVLVSDDNFAPDQVTQIVVLAV
ncbi:esterase-like activity of phytase family protein [Saccharopolyspora rectivirgula]|jgi:hypothetical protein|uniref:3-phytase n=1 Tax=Saccharopolyspora rectivirgula TaxID=28042 RepID=A0A073AWR0_9PSEU|nr:esterase-like activity of phytase family protein [Saccharopolyspora rectivirgula]KEI43761.1 3-phytase [Saccharopolyspora rectivirgula]